jgi:hypothetical protein
MQVQGADEEGKLAFAVHRPFHHNNMLAIEGKS